MKLNEEVPYRTPVSSLPLPATTSSLDEQEFSTLKAIQILFSDGMDRLNKFNAFDLTESEMKIKQQIKAHQLAYEILVPLLESLNSTINQINSKYRSR